MERVYAYELWFDGKPTGIEIEGRSKKSAFEMQAEAQRIGEAK